nr:glycosyltransferase family 4 protein [Polaribacter huanghezhanensis]
MKRSNILYIGNDLSNNSNYPTTIKTLTNLLQLEGFKLIKTSNKENKILRMIDMCLTIVKHSKVDYILIDTYSTANFYYAFFTSQIARLFKIKYIPILHGGNLPFRLEDSRKLSKLIFKNSYRNIAPSNYLKHEFEKKGYPSVLIPNVIEIKDYKFKERKVLQPKLLFVRAFDEIYNPLMAIDVLRKLKVKYLGATLCMIGPDKDGSLEKVKQLAKEKNVLDDIEFTGVLSKKDWHKKSEDFDIFINTTNVDNTPVSLIEAMALGLPIVSTDAGGIPYLISNEVDGLLINKGDIDQMVNEIISLLEGGHPEIAKKARHKVESFNWDIVKYKWFKILK